MDQSHARNAQRLAVCKYFLLFSPVILILDYVRDIGFNFDAEIFIAGFLAILNPSAYFFLRRTGRPEHTIRYTLTVFFVLLAAIHLIDLRGGRTVELTWSVLFPFAFVFLGDRTLGLILSTAGLVMGFSVYFLYQSMAVDGLIPIREFFQVQIVFAVATVFAVIYESSRSRSVENMISQVEQDPLTQTTNRRGIELVLSTLITAHEQGDEDESGFGVIVIDIDDFKAVNDVYGHDEGDRVLREVSQLLKGMLRTTDTIGRWGGEEFIVVLPGAHQLETARFVAEKLRSSLGTADFGLDRDITASFGIAVHELGESVEALFKRADERMYHAKRSGKDRVM